MPRELDPKVPDALGEAEPPREGAGHSVEIAAVMSVRRGGSGLTITKRNLTFKNGQLVSQGKDYQLRINDPSVFGRSPSSGDLHGRIASRGALTRADPDLQGLTDPPEPLHEDWLSMMLDVSPGLASTLDELADELGCTPDDVFVKAVVLLKVAVDARKEGKGLAIVDQDLEVESEITGF